MCTFTGNRRFTSVLNCSLLVLFILAVPRPALGQDISITDFRIPTSKYQKFLGGLSGRWTKNDVNTVYPVSLNPIGLYQGMSSSQTSNLQTSINYNLGDFSEEHSLEISFMMEGQGGYNESRSSAINRSDISSSSQLQRSYQLTISPFGRYSGYWTPDTWHWFVEGSGNYSFDQTKSTSDRTDNTSTPYHYSSFSKQNAWDASIGGGIGYGKVRDGSPVFAVLRILEKLEEDSLLSRQLEKEELIRLVDILARRIEYQSLHDRYVKFLMSDLFVELQKMGVLKGNVPIAYSVERAAEVLSEQIEPRLFGWRARAGFQRTYVDGNSARDDDYYFASHTWNFHDFFRFAVDYGYPLSPNLHFTSAFTVDVPRIDYQRKINLSINVRGIYQIGERIDATISGSALRNQSVNAGIEDDFTRMIQYNVGIGLRFFIENQVSFTVSTTYNEMHGDIYYRSYQTKNMSKGPGISFGVSYRFF